MTVQFGSTYFYKLSSGASKWASMQPSLAYKDYYNAREKSAAGYQPYDLREMAEKDKRFILSLQHKLKNLMNPQVWMSGFVYGHFFVTVNGSKDELLENTYRQIPAESQLSLSYKSRFSPFLTYDKVSGVQKTDEHPAAAFIDFINNFNGPVPVYEVPPYLRWLIRAR